MIDFVDSRYLGLRHPSAGIRGWTALTTGRPAALGVDPAQLGPAAALAALQGLPAALLARSVLHGLLDVFTTFGGSRAVALVDERAYPTSVLALAAARVSRVAFAHHDSADLARRIARLAAGARPIVVTDGACPACGHVAPLAAYQRLAAAAGGLLVVDDTVALGLLGTDPSHAVPYGRGGGGSLRWSAAPRSGTVTVCSLAKAFGAPVAVIAGETDVVRAVARRGPMQVHGSQPSAADVAAVVAALDINASIGERLRARLLHLVARLRYGLARLGLPLATAGCLPIQSVGPLPRAFALRLAERLGGHRVLVALQQPHRGSGVLLTWVLTAAHQEAAVGRALAATAKALTGPRPARLGGRASSTTPTGLADARRPVRSGVTRAAES